MRNRTSEPELEVRTDSPQQGSPLRTPSQALRRRSVGRDQATEKLSQPKAGEAETPCAVEESHETRERNWRDAIATACADMLHVTLDDLRRRHERYRSERQGKAPGAADRSFAIDEGDLGARAPRDFADYVIMKTLRAHDVFSMQNARSWTFNLMDRTGDGRAYRPEFVRYAPLMPPIADGAIAELEFEVLAGRAHRQSDCNEEAQNGDQQGDADGSSRGVRPVDAAEPFIGFETWDSFLAALVKILTKPKPEWTEAKKLLQVEPGELLVKSHTAIDHSGMFPIPGKLFLSERYLAFIAALGRSHFLLPLELVRGISTTELPIIRRDCLVVTFEPPSRKDFAADTPVIRFAPSTGAERRLLFSFSEFRYATQRDAWHAYVSEMAASFWCARRNNLIADGVARMAMRLPRELSETSSAAIADAASMRPAAAELPKSAMRAASGNTVERSETADVTEVASLYYADLPPPVLARVARMNIIRSRALKRVNQGALPTRLLVFAPDWRLESSDTGGATSDDGEVLRRKHEALSKYVAAAKQIADGERRSWLSRAVQRVNVNLEVNRRRREAEREDEPLDISLLSRNIALFIELLAPFVVLFQGLQYVVQWVQPVLSAIVLVALLVMVAMNWVKYLFPVALATYAVFLLLIRVQLAGPAASDQAVATASERTTSFSLIMRVHNGLRVTQSALQAMNYHLAKVESLHLWRAPHLTWRYLAALALVVAVTAVVPFRWLFGLLVVYCFTLQFRNPDARDFVDEWYEAIPGRAPPGEGATAALRTRAEAPVT
ncbi:hypothetical protein CDCA_CDCA17G4345 [Cyanidium caldarium]|uniref:GRAM domain-containing protein n=1 Tax=Cyanidium caldarium TaxID=2771 RepID=A0AAV9J1X2_CYACA|nr:hypothetical protein CDCA_CDCA17G4345 [Cyanidium caldarium]